MLIRIHEIPTNLVSYLSDKYPVTFHSDFKSGFNIRIEDQIIYIGRRKGSTSLFVDPHLLSRYMIPGTKPNISIENQKIIIPSWELEFDFSQAIPTDYHLEINEISNEDTQRLMQAILDRNYDTGLDLKTDEWVDQMKLMYETDPSAMIDYLMGRGIGLTPSGDDFLVGMLSWHAMHPYLEASFMNALNEAMHENKTNEISQSFIREGISGRFYQVILDIYRSQNDVDLSRNLDRMTHFGASSGKDTLAGMLMGITLQKEKL